MSVRISRSPTARWRAVRDPDAFADFYAAESEALLVFFVRRTFDSQAALDLCAETFAQAYRGRRRFRGQTDEEARGWLYAIAHRQLARYRQRGAAERRTLERLGMSVPAVSEDDHAEIEQRAGLDVLREAIAAELRRLSEDQREAVRLRVVEELPYEQVAACLEISEPTARARVSRALRALGPRLRHLALQGGLVDE